MPQSPREINDQLSEARVRQLIKHALRGVTGSSSITNITQNITKSADPPAASIVRYNPSDPTRRTSEAHSGIVRHPDTTVLSADLAVYELLTDYQKVRQFSEPGVGITHIPAAATGGTPHDGLEHARRFAI